MTIFERIRKRREELNISQQELANRVGFKSRSAINKIENGLRDLSQSKVAVFAKALDTTPSYLMGWDDERNDEPSALTLSKHEENVIIAYRDKQNIQPAVDKLLDVPPDDIDLTKDIKKAEKISTRQIIDTK